MPALSTLLFVYVVGGLTFVPLVLAALVALIVYTSPVVEDAEERSVKGGHAGAAATEEKLDDATVAIKDRPKAATKIYRSGWLTVRRTFEVVQDSNPDAGYMDMVTSSYRSFLDARSRDPKRSRPKDRFYAVLKDSILFLYEDDQESDCFAAIKMTLHDVVIYPEGLIDGELFMKRNAICLRPHIQAGDGHGPNGELPSLILHKQPTPNGTSTSGAGTGTGATAASDKKDVSEDSSTQPWFLFPSINHDKEDWYHSLVQSSRLTEPSDLSKDASLFDSDDMARLVEAIDDQPDPIPTRWLNAMLGRLFFSVYRTSAVENYIVRKLIRKLAKVNRPGFLGEFEVKEVNVGASTPFFSKPMLKELTAEGDASMEMQVKYVGDFRITIATTATINLGSRFKSYSVRLVLAVVLKQLEGTLLFKIKRPPSNRVWFGFTAMPKMVLNVEPVVSTRQIKWSMITKPIESSLRKLILESIVLPHMDDIAFLNTKPYLHRGGIFADCARKAAELPTHIPTAESGEETDEEAETGGVPPGVPNLKLGDNKSNGVDGLRQRHTKGDKTVQDDAVSVKSTQSAPLIGDQKKEKEHARKRSWFSSSTSLRNKLPSTNENDTNASSASSNTSLTEAAKYKLAQSRAEAARDDSDSVAERLRDILDSGKAKAGSTSTEGSVRITDPYHLGLPNFAPERADSDPTILSSSPQHSPNMVTPILPSSASFESLDSGDTRNESKVTAIASAAKGTETQSKTPSLFRRASDKSINSTRSVSSAFGSAPVPTMSQASQESTSSGASQQTISSTTSAIIQTWKTKANDKQAIQAGVNQAKDAMAKWSSKWQNYKRAHNTANPGGGEQEDPLSHDAAEPVADVFGEPAFIGMGSTAATPTVKPREDHVTSVAEPSRPAESSPRGASSLSSDKEQRPRSGSLISTSPTGQFKPSAPVPATSVTTTDPATSHFSSSPTKTTASQPIRRVPPPSTVPVHPAFSNKRKTSTSGANAYRPAAMMSVPGIDDSRRFAVSSEDYKTTSKEQATPALPQRPRAPVAGSSDSGATPRPTEIQSTATTSFESTTSSSPPASQPERPGSQEEAAVSSPPKLTASRFQARSPSASSSSKGVDTRSIASSPPVKASTPSPSPPPLPARSGPSEDEEKSEIEGLPSAQTSSLSVLASSTTPPDLVVEPPTPAPPLPKRKEVGDSEAPTSPAPAAPHVVPVTSAEKASEDAA